ncbi:hypothetical protein EVAR_54699_1 [Eumeta japonica]|uniref:Uncharacterized protein n=1 Tax=Eumeta variegata TaxID=151549 RepID=A0A4C1X6W5_EUMVA|nr:hypothetical protein EVAR_54699_1 [Eumeta japonica]
MVTTKKRRPRRGLKHGSARGFHTSSAKILKATPHRFGVTWNVNGGSREQTERGGRGFVSMQIFVCPVITAVVPAPRCRPAQDFAAGPFLYLQEIQLKLNLKSSLKYLESLLKT